MHIVDIALPSGLRLTLEARPGVWSWRRMGYIVQPESPEEAWARLIAILKATDMSALIRAYSMAPDQLPKTERKTLPVSKDAKVSSIRDVVGNLRAQDAGSAKLPAPAPQKPA
jgi:hypothetical protein